MGGSGSTSRRTEQHQAPDSKQDGSSGNAGATGSSVKETFVCPEVRTAILIDVAAAGNAVLASSLPPGSSLNLVEDGKLYRVDSGGSPLGWIPQELSTIIKNCTQQGYAYAVVLRRVTAGTPPRIEVTVQRP